MIQLPEEFKTQISDLLGSSAEDLFESLDNSTAPVSVRNNPNKFGIGSSIGYGPDTEPIPWCPMGVYLPERPSFVEDPIWHSGGYYVQEASSMIVYQLRQLMTAGEALKVLDLCAAPGGKSTLLSSILPAGSVLVSNEPISQRASILAENTAKWGSPNVIVTEADPEKLVPLGETFDMILVDAPCSGEGMFRKDEQSRKEWSVDLVKLSAKRQQRILNAAWQLLKPGGYLAYSTCTFNTLENEDNLAFLQETFGAESIELQMDKEWNLGRELKGSAIAYRFWPHRQKGEGLFFAVMRKTDSLHAHSGMKKKAAKKMSQSDKRPIIPGLKVFINDNDRYEWRWMGDNVLHALPKQVAQLATDLTSISVRMRHAGIAVGMEKGKDLIPTPALALSTEVDVESFDTMELSKQEALNYLARQDIATPTDLPRGYILVTYLRRPLGFIKHLVNRSNNLYPAEWRIRKLQNEE